MTVYVVLHEDRHTDTEAYLFSTPEKAIAFAQSILDDNQASLDLVPEDERTLSESDMAEAGLIFQCTYSNEGDSVWAYAAEIDEECN